MCLAFVRGRICVYVCGCVDVGVGVAFLFRDKYLSDNSSHLVKARFAVRPFLFFLFLQSFP